MSLSRWIDDHPQVYLMRAYMWLAAVPIFIYLGWHTSVFVIFLWSSWANFSGDSGVYEAAKMRKERRDDDVR